MLSSLLLLSSTLSLCFSLVRGTCSPLPNPLPAPANYPLTPTLPDPFQCYSGQRLNSTADWASRRAEIKTLVQATFYGYYPDHSQETVTATRSGNTIRITVTAAGKSGSFNTTLTLPAGASPAKPIPVVISAGGVDNNVFIGSGVGIATFDTGSVAADSTAKTGAFWSLYSGRDIGMCWKG